MEERVDHDKLYKGDLHWQRKRAYETLTDQDEEAFLKCLKRIKKIPHLEGQDRPRLTQLLAHRKTSIEFFCQSKAWQEWVTEEELNELHERDHRTAISMLCGSKVGIALLDRDVVFRKKITSAGFIAGKRTLSAAYQLLSYDAGIAAVIKHGDLKHKVTASILNDGSLMDSMPLVYELCKSLQGLELLADPDIRSLITAEGLNCRTSHLSALRFMVKHPQGIALLADNVFRQKFSTATLNLPDAQGITPLHVLCESDAGCLLLEAHADFRHKMQESTLNGWPTNHYSPLFNLLKSPIGRAVLLASKKLCKLISEEALNHVVRQGEVAGESPLFWLIATPEGQQILARDKRLRSCMQRSALLAQVEYGEFAGKKAIDLLIANEALLAIMPQSVRQIIADMQPVPPSVVGVGMFQAMQEVAPDKELRPERRCIIL